MAQFGQTIAAVGDKGFQLAEEIRVAEEGGKISAFMRQASMEASRFEDGLISRQDPENWKGDSAQMISQMRNQLATLELSPEAQGKALGEFEGWAVRKTLQFEGLAARKIYQNSQAKFAGELNYHASRGDLNQYEQAVSRGIATGLVGEADRDRLQREGLRMATLRELSQRREEDPRALLEEVRTPDFVTNTPGISEVDRERLVRGLEADVQAFQKEQLKAISTAIETGEVSTEEELRRQLERSPYIEEALHDELLFNFQQAQPVDAESRFAITDQLNELHDAYKSGEMNLDDYRAAHDEVAQVVYAMGARDGSGALRQRVHALDPAAWNGKNLQEARDQSREREISKLSAVYQKAGAFGSIDEDEELSPFEYAERETEILRRRERVEERMTEWLRDNPEAKDFDQQFRKVAMDEIAGSVLSGGSVPVEERRRSLSEMLGEAGGPPGARDATPDQPVGGSLKDMVKQFEAGGEAEGFHRKAYWDHGQWSIGYGTKAQPGEVIDKAEAARRLDVELSQHRKRVEDEAARVGIEFEPHELDALTSFDFNTGKIRQLLAGGTRSKAEIASKILLYRNASGKRLRGLERRRIAESKLFRRGW